ncbi:MAG: hypothetical protein IT208_00730 [Chthonomonadales bacterium]|nr:hypothetical protein [Chthonomonadales bacterium]
MALRRLVLICLGAAVLGGAGFKIYEATADPFPGLESGLKSHGWDAEAIRAERALGMAYIALPRAVRASMDRGPVPIRDLPVAFQSSLRRAMDHVVPFIRASEGLPIGQPVRSADMYRSPASTWSDTPLSSLTCQRRGATLTVRNTEGTMQWRSLHSSGNLAIHMPRPRRPWPATGSGEHLPPRQGHRPYP